MQVSNAAVSQMIAKYEGKGWLRRVHSNVDRRTVFVQIEPDFLTQIQEKGKAHKKALNDYLEYLGDDDIEHLYRILNKTFVYLEKAHD